MRSTPAQTRLMLLLCHRTTVGSERESEKEERERERGGMRERVKHMRSTPVIHMRNTPVVIALRRDHCCT